MVNLRDAALQATGELWQLEFIELDKVEIIDKFFTKTEIVDGKSITKEVPYKRMVINGKEYPVNEKMLNKIKEQLEKKPLLKKFRFMKLDDGKLICVALE